MPTLQFMPWCRIDKTYSVGDITLVPFHRDGPVEGLDELTTLKVKVILSSYKDLEGHPVLEAALVQHGTKSPLADLSDDELELTRDYAQLACFSGLAKREYFNQLGSYCNSDCFTLYGQRFEDLAFVAITSRRREGRPSIVRPLVETIFSIPVHVSSVKKVSLDEQLLAALLNFRKEASAEEWSRWQNAISCFNQGNTDNDAIRHQVEWVLLCSAFEHILEAKSDYEDVAERFARALVPNVELLVQNSRRQSDRWKDKGKPLRYEWMKEFYRVRGDFAHGKLQTQQPTVWIPLEHVVLASIGFPLLVRCLLRNKQKYELTDKDKAQINSFEELADEPFLTPPNNQKNSIDSRWSRFVNEQMSTLRNEKLVEDLKAKGLWK